MSRLLIHQASQSSANPPGLAIPGTTAFTGEAGQLPQTGPGSRQRLGTAGAAPRRCHCLGLAFNLCCLPGNSLPVLSGVSP